MNTQSNQSNNEIKMLHEVIADYKLQNEKLQEHLKKSREVSNRLIGENNTTMPPQSVLYRKNKELKEENKELKEANNTFTLGAKRTIESNCKLYKENKELKAALVNCVISLDN